MSAHNLKYHVLVTLDSVKLPETTREGVLLVTGSGDCGQLGLGPDVLEKSRPAVVQTENEIVDICAGGMHTVCLTKTGKVIFMIIVMYK
jgi:regulator of chromosome condensation